MMKIQTAGLAGAALVAAVMGVAVLGTGPGNGSSSLAAAPGQSQSSVAQDRPGGAGDAGNGDARAEPFAANEHQPQLKLPDGATLTLLAVSNGEDGWWHADGSQAQHPRRTLPAGVKLADMSVTFDEGDALIDLALFVECGAGAEGGPEFAGLLDADRKAPGSSGVGINSTDGRASWRLIIPQSGDADRADLNLALATGKAEKVGTIARDGDGWSLDAASAKWVALGRADDAATFEVARGAAAGMAITLVGLGGEGAQVHGNVADGRMSFDADALRNVDRFDVYARPMTMVALSEVSLEAGNATQPTMKVVQDVPAMMAEAWQVMPGQAAHAHRSAVQVRQAGGGRAHAHTHAGAASAAVENGHNVVRAGGGHVEAHGTGGATAVHGRAEAGGGHGGTAVGGGAKGGAGGQGGEGGAAAGGGQNQRADQ